MASFPERWIHGAPDCGAAREPPFQAHWFDERTCILRQGKCVTFEAPFLFLLRGDDAAMLIDTGGHADAGGDVPLRETVEALLARWPALPLLVAHTHSHDDHVYGDRYFTDRPDTRIIGHTVEEVAAEYGITGWPEGIGSIDLGGRRLDVIAAPGHEPASVCFYDAARRLLLTGDVLYPGKLTVRDRRAYRDTARRLAGWEAEHPVDWVLGCHVEMKRAPGEFYEIGTIHQPDEHPLQLTGADLREWAAACEDVVSATEPVVRDRFVIWPV